MNTPARNPLKGPIETALIALSRIDGNLTPLDRDAPEWQDTRDILSDARELIREPIADLICAAAEVAATPLGVVINTKAFREGLAELFEESFGYDIEAAADNIESADYRAEAWTSYLHTGEPSL